MPPELSLTLIKGVPRTRPETRTISLPEYRLGRGEPDGTDVDWMLPDPSLTVSRLHCVLSRDQDDWSIVDVSRNGTWINQEQERIPPRVPRLLHNGDRLRIGDYEFQVELPSRKGLSAGPHRPPPRSAPPPPAAYPWGSDDLPPGAHPGFEPAAGDQMAGGPLPPDPGPGDSVSADPRVQQADPHALLSRLAHGAGVPSAALSAESMHQIGQALRSLVHGLRRIEAARQTIRSGFRISDPRSGGNPLTGAATEQEALEALLTPGRSSMPPGRAVADILTEIGRHELATIAAMRTAILALLRNLSPDALQQMAGQNGALSVLATQRKAKAWDEFASRYAAIRDALEDDFDRTFGRTFADAYERALAAMSDQDRQA